VDFVAISANDVGNFPDDAPGKMAQRAREKGYPFPYLYDESQAVAQAYGAACTPDFFLYGPERELAYRGRLDDNWKEPENVQCQDLRDAIDAVLAGKPAAEPQMAAIGCNIKWKEEK
jgi:peroxiredoxin